MREREREKLKQEAKEKSTSRRFDHSLLVRPAGAAAVQRSQRAKERHTQIISTGNETANLLLERTKNSGKKKKKKNVGARRSEKRAPGDTFTR